MATINPKLAARIAALRAAKEQASGDSRSASVTETVEEKANGSNNIATNRNSSTGIAIASGNTSISVPVASGSTARLTAIPTPQPHTFKPSVVKIGDAGEYEPFKMKLAELEQQLEEQVPGFANTLRDIHRAIGQDANIVTILSEEEIAVIVQGLAKHMDTTVVVAKKTSTKRTQPVTAEDL